MHRTSPAVILALSIAAIGVAQQPAPEAPRLERSARIEDPAPLGVGRLIPDLALAPLTGNATMLSNALEVKNGVVIAMTSVSCPAAMKYIPRLASIEDEYAAKGVPFIFVNTVDDETEPDMRRVITDQRLAGLYLGDRNAAVAKALCARSTTEVNARLLTSTAITHWTNCAITSFFCGTGMRECSRPTSTPGKAALSASWVAVAFRRSSASLSSISGQTQ